METLMLMQNHLGRAFGSVLATLCLFASVLAVMNVGIVA
jgi:hypothetical protein